MIITMKIVTLNNKRTIPAVGFGTWRPPKSKATSLVEAASEAATGT